MKGRLTRDLRTRIITRQRVPWVLCVCVFCLPHPRQAAKETGNLKWPVGPGKMSPNKSLLSLPKRLEKGSLARQKTFRKQLLYRKKHCPTLIPTYEDGLRDWAPSSPGDNWGAKATELHNKQNKNDSAKARNGQIHDYNWKLIEQLDRKSARMKNSSSPLTSNLTDIDRTLYPTKQNTHCFWAWYIY